MTRPLRIEYPGSFWHITQRGNARSAMFRGAADCLHFLDLLARAVRRFEWQLTAYALMLNHYHLALEVTADHTLSSGLAWLNGQYARYFNRRYERVGHLVQGRPGMYIIEKETYFLEVLRYVALNPVRAAVVRRPEEYAWTSYRATAGLIAPPPWLAVDEVLTQFALDRALACALYKRFIDDGIRSTRRPWDDAVGSMYVGSERWLEQVRERVESQPRVTEHVRTQRELLRPSMSQIVGAVAETMGIPEDRIRNGRGGLPRAIAAWIGCYEGHLTNGEIGATLRLRADSRVAALIAGCERELKEDASLRGTIDECLATLRRKNRKQQT